MPPDGVRPGDEVSDVPISIAPNAAGAALSNPSGGVRVIPPEGVRAVDSSAGPGEGPAKPPGGVSVIPPPGVRVVASDPPPGPGDSSAIPESGADVGAACAAGAADGADGGAATEGSSSIAISMGAAPPVLEGAGEVMGAGVKDETALGDSSIAGSGAAGVGAAWTGASGATGSGAGDGGVEATGGPPVGLPGGGVGGLGGATGRGAGAPCGKAAAGDGVDGLEISGSFRLFLFRRRVTLGISPTFVKSLSIVKV